MLYEADDSRRERRRASQHSIYVCYPSQDGSNIEEKHACSSNDISEGGLRITTSRPIPLGCILPIELIIESSDTTFRFQGEVKWCLEIDEVPTYFAGIKLLDLIGDSYRDWQAFVSKR